MLEELLRFNTIGSKDELHFVLLKVPFSNNRPLKELQNYCCANLFSIGKTFYGIIKLLEYIELIEVTNGKLLLKKENPEIYYSSSENGHFYTEAFFHDLMDALKKSNGIRQMFNPESVKYEQKEDTFYIKDNLVPFRFLPLRNLLLNLGFVSRDEFGYNLLVRKDLNPIFNKYVVKELSNFNELKNRRRLTLRDLKRNLEQQEKLGKEAEEFVVEFEMKRLSGHRSLNQITSVTEEFCNAGYDIISFDDSRSIVLDRYIEVKSFSKNLEFYWSRNELDTAKELKNKYFLYLVDRTKMHQEAYSPKVIQDPYTKIFHNDFWTKDPENWRVSFR